MKKWNLCDIIYNDEYDYGFSTTLDNGDEVELYNSKTFMDKIYYKYTSWCITSPSFYDTNRHQIIEVAIDVDEAINTFHYMYQQWMSDKRNAFTKLYQALISKYNPIWNVDGVTGTVIEDTHTGTDTNAKTGTDTSNLSGNDTTASSGSDINTLSGRDVDTLSGTDSNEHTGTIADAHTGTITNAKNVTKDETTKTGNETIGTSGTDTDTKAVTTFDDDITWHNSEKNSKGYGKTDTHTYNNLKDSHLYTDSNTETHNDTDTRTHNNTDATTYGKVDTMSYGKIDTLQHGKTDTTTYGKQDQMTYNSQNVETKNLSDKHVELQIRQGNIGVTKTQELIEAQIDLTARDSLVEYMIADFVHNNCVI